MNDGEDDDERRLIDRAVAGDANACAALVRAHYASVYRLLVHLTRGDAHLAEDLCQDTFAVVWAKLATFTGGSALATWVHRIAYRRFLDSRRAARKGRARPDENDGTARDRDAVDGPLAASVAGEEAAALHAAIDRLQPADRQAIAMHYLSGLSYREIAAITDEPLGTVKWRTSAALGRLRVLLRSETDDEPERRATTSSAAARDAGAAGPAGA